MPQTAPDMESLLAEIERLKLENAILRRAAGIQILPAKDAKSLNVTDEERQALLRKTTKN